MIVVIEIHMLHQILKLIVFFLFVSEDEDYNRILEAVYKEFSGKVVDYEVILSDSVDCLSETMECIRTQHIHELQAFPIPFHSP